MKPLYRNRQRGAVLVIALLFLTILTILGVTAMTATTFEEKMAGNARDSSLAFQAADAALRDARRDLNGIVVPPFTAKRNPKVQGTTGFGDLSDTDNGSCSDTAPTPYGGPDERYLGLCRPQPYDASKGQAPPQNTTASLTGPPSVEYGRFTGALMPAGMLSRKPRYLIEVLCYVNPDDLSRYCGFYRITARGYGGNPNTQVTLQEIFLLP
jgi:type IV pilus assembly protein PilX